jgi:LuxR family maltose regulon positive regulatory protein
VGVSPLLLTKLHPPPAREQTVQRDRLVELLRGKPETRLTVVAAPAGSGKTTLLGEWRESEAGSHPVAWLSIDDGDNDPVVLWSYVLEALRSVCPGLGVVSPPDLRGASRIADVFLPQLINELSAVGGVSLILDDFQQLKRGPARDSIGWFVERTPSTFHLILGTRSEPALPLAALRAHGALVEVRAHHLAFTSSEADLLVNDRLALGLEREYIDDLVSRTEGWAAGLYLAALSLQAVEDRQAFVSEFGAQNRYVVDFLVDEVLEAHDPATQTLMLRSSILERLSGSLCDAVLEREGSGQLLGALARSNLFLVPVDDRGDWYRFHHLFAQLLRVELEHREPGLAPMLHRRACAWHRRNGSIEAAIGHAIAAGAFDDAAGLIGAEWVSYAHLSRHATVLSWLRQLPEERVRTNPHLLLVKAWMHSLSGEREAASGAIAALEQLRPFDPGPQADGFSSLEASLFTLRALVPWGDIGSGLENARRAIELEGPESPWRAHVCAFLGEGLYYSGEYDEAAGWFRESVGVALSRGQWLIAMSALAHWSLLSGERGRTDEQQRLADDMRTLAHERGLDEEEGMVFVEGMAFVALGAALEAHGELEDALALIERGVSLQRNAGYVRPLSHALIRQGSVLSALGRRNEADAVIAEARALIDTCKDPGFLTAWLAALETVSRKRPQAGPGELSRRELAILRMLAGNLTERDIARELYLSHNTVHSHTKSIYRKLGVSSRAAAIERARKLGLSGAMS